MTTPYAVGLDLASVNAAMVGLSAGLPPVERAVTAAPKEALGSPLRDLDMADRILFSLLPIPAAKLTVLCIEHTPFMARQAGAAMTGVVRGALYSSLRAQPLFDRVLLVNPSQWRSFHGITATGKNKIAAYAEAASALGFVSALVRDTKKHTDKARQDATAAFLIAKVAEAIALDPTDPRVKSILANPNNRIVP